MRPDSLESLKYIAKSKTGGVTRAAFVKKYSEELLLSILASHVDEVDGKLVLNTAGNAVLEHFKALEGK